MNPALHAVKVVCAVSAARAARAIGFSLLGVLALAGCASPSMQPSVTPTAPAGSLDGDMERDQAEEYWEFVVSMYPDATRPEAERVRFISPDEWAQVQVDCLNGEGFRAEASSDGGLAPSAQIPEAQMEGYAIARYICTVKYPFDPKYLAPISPEQIDLVYDYYVDTLIPCLEREGYPVDDPPSRALFRDTYETEDRWMPYEVLLGSSQSEWDRVGGICPQMPSASYLFGE